ncbi:MAG TPA: substrate-binding domain-containing protein [Thermoleophilia bacterium]
MFVISTTESRTPNRLVRNVALVGLAFSMALAAGCGQVQGASTASSGAAPGGGAKVLALLMSDNTTSRWFQIDVPNITKDVKTLAPDVKVLTYNAQNSPDTQLSQARTALGQGAKVLLVESVDPTSAGAIVSLAHEQGAKVISYVHQILKSPIDYFVGFDAIQLGQQEGKWMVENTKAGDRIVLINGWAATSLSHDFETGYMTQLGPLFDSNQRILLEKVFTPQWLASSAQTEMSAFLSKYNNKVDAVLAENDQMAGGVIAALQAAGLAGQVKVTGLDSEPAALQRILLGTQSMTIHPSFQSEAQNAAQVATDLLNGRTPSADLFAGKTVDTGSGTAPWAVTPTTAITKDNMNVVIDDGFITKATLCQGLPAQGFCA